MYIRLMDVIGPVMIGPSSSHTAGAAKLARTAMSILNRPFCRVVFGLGGSFAHTYEGHFTDRALVAGVLGMREDDENLENSFDIAAQRNITYTFQPEDINGNYDNLVRFTFHLEGDEPFIVEGASLGGGRILITNIQGLACAVSAEVPTLIIQQMDKEGVVRDIASILSIWNINIASMNVNRTRRGDMACTIIECDQKIPQAAQQALKQQGNIRSVIVIDV